MTAETEIAAECLGVRVPASRFLHERRIERINAGQYEGHEIAGALHVITPEDVVLELGAGIGIVGAVVAANCKPKAVHSFEANPNLIPVIRALYDENELNDRISVTNKVLLSAADRPETIPFHIHNSYLGSSLAGEGKARETVSIETAGFNETAAELGATVLVMDIEGGEQGILEHADLTPFRAIVLEFHPKAYGVDGMQGCKKTLRSAGFKRIEDKSTRLVWTCTRDA